MTYPVDRRTFLNTLTVSAAAAAAAGSATYFAAPRPAHAAFKAKGNVPDKPFKTGHITFLTGPANLLGEPGRNAAVAVVGAGVGRAVERGEEAEGQDDEKQMNEGAAG